MRLIRHPVMGWYVIILLTTIVAIPPTYFLVSRAAAQWVSLVGMFIAMNFAIGGVLWDHFTSRRSN